MIACFLVAAAVLGVDVEGGTNRDIQKAIDQVAAQGGGEVHIPAGTYEMDDSLHLRSRVRIRGDGPLTVLKKRPSVSSPLSADLGYGHYDASLAEPEKFSVGMGICIHDDGSFGFYDTVAAIQWKNGDRVGLSKMLNHDYYRSANATAVSVFPVVSGDHVEDAAIENLTIDGNGSQNARLNGCRGGGVYLLQSHRVRLAGLCVRDYNGDGVSFQQCKNTRIENCILEGMTATGIHPGSGSVGAIMRGNTCRNNGGDGIYYCLRVSFSSCEDNIIEHNAGFGISIGQRDTDHLLRRNTIRGNAKSAIQFRDCDSAMASTRDRLEENHFEDNCRKEGSAEIDIQGATSNIHILNNTFRAGKTQASPYAALCASPQARQIVFHNNRIEDTGMTPIRASDSEIVSTAAPAEPLAVGADCAGPTSEIHLRAETPAVFDKSPQP